ncbi:hypothetical protein [Spirobacillus cienkowskii]|uniref:hypothetical protein n=1 Tax=Spirobacillus cienkowskii TaxID=495820 RepID=UPI0030D22551
MLLQCQQPLLLLLTHRRGAAMFLCSDTKNLSNFLISEKNIFSILLSNLQNKIQTENVEYLKFDGLIFTRAIGKTAENLYLLYTKTLELANLTPHQIKTIVIGIGPGSFTGLRLGCAFINGMKIANNTTHLLPVATLLTPELLSICESQNCKNICIEQLDEFSEDDESSGNVTFFDLLICLQKAHSEKRNFVESLIPEYGKEPGPVVKLKEEMGLSTTPPTKA